MSSKLSEVAVTIETAVKALVDSPEDVQVSELVGTQATVIEVTVAKGEQGKVIGRRGKTADALRTLLEGMGGKVQRRFMLEVLD